MPPKQKAVSELGSVVSHGHGFRARLYIAGRRVIGPQRGNRAEAQADLDRGRQCASREEMATLFEQLRATHGNVADSQRDLEVQLAEPDVLRARSSKRLRSNEYLPVNAERNFGAHASQVSSQNEDVKLSDTGQDGGDQASNVGSGLGHQLLARAVNVQWPFSQARISDDAQALCGDLDHRSRSDAVPQSNALSGTDHSLVTLGRTPQPASKEITQEGIVAQDCKSQLPNQVACVSLASRRIVGKQGARRQAHPSRRRNVGVAGTITISGEWPGGAPSLDGAKRAHKTWRHLNKT